MTAWRMATLIAAAALIAGCGGSSKTASTGGAAPSSGALSAEANSAATGDIPDTQAFLVFRNPAAGYSIKYPEGWAQSGGAGDVTFRDKNNIVRIVVAAGGAPSATSVAADLAREKGSTPSLKAGAPRAITLPAGRAIKVTYTTESPPNPVTGKQVVLTVDRYVVGRGGERATIDLGTPVGVDNVDAYRMMSQSFHWQ